MRNRDHHCLLSINTCGLNTIWNLARHSICSVDSLSGRLCQRDQLRKQTSTEGFQRCRNEPKSVMATVDSGFLSFLNA